MTSTKSKVKQSGERKNGWHHLDREVRQVFFEKVTFKLKPKWQEGASHLGILGMNFSGLLENGQCKGPEVAMGLTVRQRQDKYGWQAVNEWLLWQEVRPELLAHNLVNTVSWRLC